MAGTVMWGAGVVVVAAVDAIDETALVGGVAAADAKTVGGVVVSGRGVFVFAVVGKGGGEVEGEDAWSAVGGRC